MRYSPENDPHHRGRRKGTANRQWLVVSSAGESYLEEVGKHSIMKRTGLPARDLRVLDPLLSYPSTILGRERAIVINLEQIKAVITATEVLVPNSKDPMVGPFVKDLIDRVSNPNGIHHQAMEPSATVCNVAMPKATSCWPSFPGHHGVGRQDNISPRPNAILTNTSSGEMAKRNSRSESNPCKVGAMLPFEFKALEGCLESACRSLESETLTLEKEAYPALDELTSKLSTLNLERVRQLKSRLVAISGRVQKVRDEVEHLLDDDMDMAEMYLSEKLARQPVGESSAGAGDVDEPEHDDDREEDGRSATESSRGSMSGFKPNVEELEMLLEAYFVQIDGTLNKLSHLREYVDDTEDYINIMLDEKQNQLLQMGVMLSTATLVLTAGVVVVSIFGMNITISLYDKSNPHAYAKFWQATFGTIAGCVGLYILATGWGKKSGLLQ